MQHKEPMSSISNLKGYNMNYVEPIRVLKKIFRIKKLIRKEEKLKELVLFENGIKRGLRISDILNLM